MWKGFFLLLFINVERISAQYQNNNFVIGIFTGEPSGILIEKKVYKKLLLELNFGVNELFFKFNYFNKYIYRKGQDYDKIYSATINIIYQDFIRKNYWNIIIGTPVRVIYNYKYQTIDFPTPYPTLSDNPPIKKTKIDSGLNVLFGMGFPLLNNRFTYFADFGGYFEIIDKLGWSNFQIRTGIKYLLPISNP